MTFVPAFAFFVAKPLGAVSRGLTGRRGGW